MRVIAGSLGGRRLHPVRGRATRPTADRVRESLFAVLGAAVEDARVLDLYAGTGALAIEALSRGARSATCVERDPRALIALARNLAELALEDRVAIVRGEALGYTRWAARVGERYDIILCDPPYRSALAPLGEAVVAPEWWTRAVVVEHAATVLPPNAPAGVEVDTRRYGDTAITFYTRA